MGWATPVGMDESVKAQPIPPAVGEVSDGHVGVAGCLPLAPDQQSFLGRQLGCTGSKLFLEGQGGIVTVRGSRASCCGESGWDRAGILSVECGGHRPGMPSASGAGSSALPCFGEMILLFCHHSLSPLQSVLLSLSCLSSWASFLVFPQWTLPLLPLPPSTGSRSPNPPLQVCCPISCPSIAPLTTVLLINSEVSRPWSLGQKDTGHQHGAGQSGKALKS